LVDSDRQWFKSKVGLQASETSRDIAFCAHAIVQSEEIFIIEDATKDDRFFDNPLVVNAPLVIFYSGVVLKSDTNYPLGTLCVIDNKPRKLNEKQIRALKTIAGQIMNLLNYKKVFRIEKELRVQLSQKNQELESFAAIAAHDLKSPLINIMSIVNLFSKTYELQIEAKGTIMLDLIEKSARRLSLMIDGLLQFSKIDGISLLKKSNVNLSETITELTALIGNENNLKISLYSDLTTIETYPVLLDQILINLFTNSLKYSHTKIAEIELYVSDNPSHYLFIVKDNGPGIDKKYQGAIFNLFQTATNKDQFGNKGNGIGLAIVKKIIEKLGGKIYVESELGHGAEFHFSISK